MSIGSHPSLSSEERALRGRIGAHTMHSRHDAREITAPARAAFLSKFQHEVDPDGELTPEERQRRADHALRAHFARLALASARARRKSQQDTADTETDAIAA